MMVAKTSASPVVSFVVLCYNTERYVGECVRSILTMDTDVPFEVIAWDDHSPDGTFDVLRTIDDPRVRSFRSERNLGHARALERALLETRGSYIARIDSDDRYRPEFLSLTLPVLLAHPEVGMVYGDAAIIGPNGEHCSPTSDQKHAAQDYKGNEFVDLLAWNFVCAPTILVRRHLFLEHLPIPEHLAFSDWYFSVQFARSAEFYFRGAVLADYRVHPGNMHSRTTLDRSEERSIFWMLEQVYATTERTPEMQAQKVASRSHIYARQYLTLADKYFGARMDADARRCYLRAVRYEPALMLQPGPVRRLVATLISRGLYESLKARLSPRLAA